MTSPQGIYRRQEMADVGAVENQQPENQQPVQDNREADDHFEDAQDEGDALQQLADVAVEEQQREQAQAQVQQIQAQLEQQRRELRMEAQRQAEQRRLVEEAAAAHRQEQQLLREMRAALEQQQEALRQERAVPDQQQLDGVGVREDRQPEVQHPVLQPQRANDGLDLERIVSALQRPSNKRVKPPTFEGRSDVTKFLRIFDDVRRINRWDDEEAALQLQLSLQGTAAEGALGQSYQELKESLTTRYQLTVDEARMELKTARPRKGENIYQFGDYVKRLVKLANPEMLDQQQEQLATVELVDAMGDFTLRREFKMLKPTNYADALKRISEFNNEKSRDASKTIRRVTWNRETADGEPDGEWNKAIGETLAKNTRDMQTRLDSLQQEQKGLQTQVQTLTAELTTGVKELLARGDTTGKQGVRQDERTCFFCKKAGHFKKNCADWKKLQEKQAQQKSQTSGNANGPTNN